MSAGGDGSLLRVTIFGEEYTIRTDRGEAHTRACARHVDETMRRMHQAGVSEPQRAAVLAALEITDELLGRRADSGDLAGKVEARLAEVAQRLESLLADD